MKISIIGGAGVRVPLLVGGSCGLAVYAAQTAPVLDWYRRHGTRVECVNAVGPVDEVTERALRALGR